MTIKVGDYVTYRKPVYTNDKGETFMPMGLAGCRVTAISNDFACIEWQGYFDKDGPAVITGVPLAHLVSEMDCPKWEKETTVLHNEIDALLSKK